MVGCPASQIQHGHVIAQGIQQLFVALDESLLLFFVELARDDIGLVIFAPQRVTRRPAMLSKASVSFWAWRD